ncbi:hypothetical protein HYW43_00185 [Candidatus Daviesbacteria bacterium]|nr:hypothetical protein [Candidatus Daviesbacteria bacterium]
MDEITKIAVFEGKKIRRHWDEKKEKWYFSVVDIIAALTNSNNPQVYWRVLKKRLIDEGSSETVTKCNGLKMLAADGKMRLTDVADTETVFRIIQSIPSPNAEPLKLWLARIGYERVEEAEDPEKAIDRAMQTYLRKGYSREWINQRLKSIEIRKTLTDEWENRGIKRGDEFAILTDDITFAWAGLTTKNYKRYKGLKMQSLRDKMTNIELVLNMLAEASTKEISEKEKPETFIKNRQVARRGGGVARVARQKLEIETGKKIVSGENYLPKENKRLKH